MGPMRIAPYLAQNIQRSYSRQQRVGERIAESRAKKGERAVSATEVAISSQARAAADTALENAARARSDEIEFLAEEIVNRFFHEDPKNEDANSTKTAAGSGTEAVVPHEGRAAFIRLLESYGLTIEEDDTGADGAIVNKATKEEVVRLSPDSENAAREKLLVLTRDILSEVL